MNKTIILPILTLFLNFNAYNQVLTDEQLFEKSIQMFRNTYQKFDSIFSNVDDIKTLKYVINNYKLDTIYFYQNLYVSNDSILKNNFDDKVILPIDDIWLDSVGIHIPNIIPKKVPNVSFNGIIVYKISDNFSFEYYVKSERVNTLIYFNPKRIKKIKIPNQYRITINKQWFEIDNLWHPFSIEYSSIADNRIYLDESGEIIHRYNNKFRFETTPFRKGSIRHHHVFFNFGNKNITAVCIGNKILYYKVYTDKLPFQSAKKVKPKKPFDKLLLKN